MNVRITPRGQPQREDLYGGVGKVRSDGELLSLYDRRYPTVRVVLVQRQVAEIALDDDPGDWWGT